LFAARQPKLRAASISRLVRLPGVRGIAEFHRTALFCRNLDVLLGAAVPLTTSLRILAEIMATMGDAAVWMQVVERVRHGGKLSEALAEAATLPAMAVRMLRLGEETGQLPVLAERVAVFYETKLERSLDRVVGLVGPVAIIAISIVVGGLIVSVMTSLLSVSQLIG
jgi:general secretion pathway protein F